MLEVRPEGGLPPIPNKRYFTLEEVAKLCAVKPHLVRYWEREFPELNPALRQGNPRRYRQPDVALIREIRHLLYGIGLSLEQAKQSLAGEGGEHLGSQKATSIRTAVSLKEMIAELEEVLELLCRQ